MDIIQALKEELQIGKNQVEAAVKLIDEGNTIPFIARYRKEATGSLNDEVLRQLDERLDYYTPVIIANNDTLENRPELVKSFLSATEKGYKYAIENPDESAQILHKYAPDYSMDLLKTSQEYLAGKYMEDTDRWGEMKDSVWDNYTDFMTEYGVIDHAIPAADCYTNEFLPE